MRLVYFGTGEFAVPALRALSPHVVLVVTQPDRPTGRGMKMQPTAVKTVAEELGIEVTTPEKARSPEFVARIEGLEPDALVVASYGQILSQRLLDAAKHGGINLHGSILPSYRGAAPIQRAIQNGETETGVTLMQMDKGMDSGDVIEIARTPIDPDETYGALQTRLSLIAAQMIHDWMPRIVGGDYPRTPQDHAVATFAPKIEKAEAEVDWSGDARREYDRFRAFSPAPGAFARVRGSVVKLLAAGFSEESGEPGTVLRAKPELQVALRNGSLVLREVQPEGKRMVTGRDFANGARLKPGDCLIEP